MRYFLTLVVMIGCAAQLAGQWTQLNSGTTATLYDVDFPTTLVGYVTGDSSIVLKTTDGTTWTRLTAYPQGARAGNVHFVNPDTGFVCSTDGIVYRTITGGATWDTIQLPTIEDITQIFYVHDTLGYFAGSNGVMFRTPDWGNTWTPLPAHPCRFLSDLELVGTDTIIVSNPQQGDSLFVSYNAGQSWIQAQVPVNFRIYDVAMHNADSGYGVGFPSRIYRTTDGGLTWNEIINFGLSATMSEVRIIHGNEFIAAGGDGSFGYIAITGYNEGQNYFYSSLSPAYIFGYGLEICGDSIAYLVGMNGFIMKSSAIIAGSNPSHDDTVTRDFQIYPNPCVDFIHVEWPVEWNVVAYEVHSVDGRIVLNGELDKAVNRIDLPDLESGLYIIHLSSKNGFSNSSKFIKK
jgi:photosystem II stability/assembly factor-like uncharacterized protein